MSKILLAEDDESLRAFLTRALERAGHVVSPVERGDLALARLEAERFDLLLTDIVMPEMDGIELARRGGLIDPRMRVMFITGFAAVALARRPETRRETQVLSKPFHLRDLVAAIERVLAA
jgi:two-component system cell cycle response regulator CpdR